MYSTCVSEWRVPLMKVTPETIGHVAVLADDLLGAEPVQHRRHRRPRESAPRASPRRLAQPRRLRRDDPHVGATQLLRVGRRRDARVQLALAADAQAFAVQRVRVLAAARQHRHLADLGEMPGEQAADDAGTDDADPPDHLSTPAVAAVAASAGFCAPK